MPIPSNPPFLSNVLGYAADVSVIPGTTPSGSGAFSYQSAFPQITAIPLTAGGVAPMREDFNAVFKLLSQHVYFLQSGSLYTWNNALDYLKGAHVLGSDGVEYIAQASSGPNVPDVGAKNPVSDDGTQLIVRGESERSYDSRYFGPLDASLVEARAYPLLTESGPVGDQIIPLLLDKEQEE